MIFALIGVVGTLVGAIIGALVAHWLTQRAALRKERDEDLDYRLYAEVVAATKDGSVFEPPAGSEHFIRALRLQQNGLLKRLPIPGHNYFTLPDALIRLGTPRKAEGSSAHD